MAYSSEKGYEKYRKYLYFGILNGVLAIAMLAVSVMSTINGESLRVQISGYAAGLMWCVVAFLMARVYFTAKKADEERLDRNDTMV